MSVIVKGMKMPRCCEECLAESVEENYYGDVMSTECPFIYKGYTEEVRKTGRLEECPLVEVLTPHGDLIDRDAIQYANNTTFDEDYVCRKTIMNMPTIIGAEGT